MNPPQQNNPLSRIGVNYLELALEGLENIFIYDQWGSDENYRKEKLDHFNLQHHQISLGEMTVAGGGSSFGRDQNVEDISKKKRWKSFAEDQDFLAIIRELAANPYRLELIKHLFPEDHEVIIKLLPELQLTLLSTPNQRQGSIS